jgi:hypothetical protein
MSLVVVMAVLCGLVVISYYLWPLVDWRSVIPIHPRTGAVDDIYTSVDMEIGQFLKFKWKLDPRSNAQTRALYANQPYFFKRPLDN